MSTWEWVAIAFLCLLCAGYIVISALALHVPRNVPRILPPRPKGEDTPNG